ncbi:MAG: hypothetical protein RSC92_05130, partial [Clostridia bacterium]
MNKPFLILERSSQNLRKIGDSKKIVLEGVFAVFGKENRNQRVYEEAQYLPHLEYLKEDVQNGALLGELDHPERFEVALGNVSHRITELWYDPQNRQVKGRIEILEGTPKGQIAKALLEAGVPLSISSRAAGSVLEDHRVQIQQIYTYDLVAKPGFAEAQLYNVSESDKSRIMNLASALNESYNISQDHNVAKKYGILDENVSIIEISEDTKVNIRPEAQNIIHKFKEEYIEKNDKDMNVSEEKIQELSKTVEDLRSKLSESVNVNNLIKEIESIKQYMEQIRTIQESTVNWQTDTAKAVNKLATYTSNLAKKSDKQHEVTKKLCETVDYNADVINNVQKWASHIAEGVNESINKTDLLEKWLEDTTTKANALTEWTSSIATHLNGTVDYTEAMFGRAMSKQDAKDIMNYIELVKEGKEDLSLRKKINESIENLTIKKELNEAEDMNTKMDKTGSIKVSKDTKKTSIPANVYFDPKTKTIIAKLTKSSFSKSTKPKGLKTLDTDTKDTTEKVAFNETTPKDLKTKKDLTKTDTIKVSDTDKSQKSRDFKKKQNLKTDTNKETSIKESFDTKIDLSVRRTTLDEKLAAIAA